MSEHGVTFEWASDDPNEPWKLGESIAVGLLYPYISRDAYCNGGRLWYMALAANLAIAALLGAAARQAWIAAGRCDYHVGMRCHCDNDE